MAAVVADAEWLEPDERDAVQQLLRNEYTAEPPPPPQQQQHKQQQPHQQQQEPQRTSWQQDAARPGGAKPAEPSGSESQTPQRRPGPQLASPAGAAAGQPPSEPRASDQAASDPAGHDNASEERRQQEAVLAEAAAQMATAQEAAVRHSSGAGADTAPPGVPTETFRMLREAGVADVLPWPTQPADESDSFESNPGPSWEWPAGNVMGEEGAPTSTDIGEEDALKDGPWVEGPEPPPPPLFEDDDDEALPGDDEDFVAGEGVAEALRVLESGGRLVDTQVTNEPEDAEAFKARIETSVARYEAQFLPRRKRKLTTQQIRDFDAGWQPYSRIPIEYEDIDEVRPAPPLPPNIQAQWERAQWITYLLRRAHLNEAPEEPHRRLAAAGLLAEDMVFNDAFVTLKGSDFWRDYMAQLRAAGCWQELSNTWVEMSDDRPPEWTVYNDVHLHLPIPKWYWDYRLLNHPHSGSGRPPQPPAEVARPQQRWPETPAGSAAHQQASRPAADGGQQQQSQHTAAHMPSEEASFGLGRDASVEEFLAAAEADVAAEEAANAARGTAADAAAAAAEAAAYSSGDAVWQRQSPVWIGPGDPEFAALMNEEEQDLSGDASAAAVPGQAAAAAAAAFSAQSPAAGGRSAASPQAGDFSAASSAAEDSAAALEDEWGVPRVRRSLAGNLATAVLADVCTSVNEAFEPDIPLGRRLFMTGKTEEAPNVAVRPAASPDPATEPAAAGKRQRGRLRKQDAEQDAQADMAAAARRRQSSMDGVPFADRALGVLNLGEHAQRAQQQEEAAGKRPDTPSSARAAAGAGRAAPEAEQQLNEASAAAAAAAEPEDCSIGYDSSRKLGEAWKTGRYITLNLTIMYHIDRDRGQVDQVRVGWSDINARDISDEDVIDIYLRSSGLLAWEYDGMMDAPETEREDPLLRQRRDMEDP